MTGQDQDQRSIPQDARRPRRIVRLRPRHALRALWGLVMLPIVFVLIAGLGMLGQEISAPSWVVARVAEQARTVLGGGALHFGAVTVTLAPDLHPVVRLRDAQLVDRQGAIVARFPLIESTVSPRGLLLRRAVLPQEVRIDSALFQLRREADGRFALDLGGDVVAAEWPGVAAAMARFDTAFEHPAISALRHLRVTNLRARFTDHQSGLRHSVDGGQVDVTLTGGVTRIAAALAVVTRDTLQNDAIARDPTNLRFDYQSPRASRAARFDLALENAPSRDIGAMAPAMRWLALVDAPLSLRLQAGLDAEGDLSPATVSLAMGAGAFVPQSGAEALGFSGGELDFGYDFTTETFDFTRLNLATDWGDLAATGTAMMEDVATSGLPGAIVGQLAFAGTALNPAGLFAGPVALPPSHLDMRLRFDPLQIEIADLAITPSADGESGVMRAKGDARLTPEGWDIALDAAITRISTDRLQALWPPAFRKPARDWFASHVHAGEVSDAAIALRIAPGEPIEFAYSHDFSDAHVTLLRGLPPVAGAQGFSALQDGQFSVTVAQGLVTAPTGGLVDMAGSSFTIADLRERPMVGSVVLTTRSDITDALSLVDSPPFGLMARTPLSVDVAEGQAEVTAHLAFPLRAGVGMADLRYAVTARLQNLTSRQLVPGQVLRGDDLAMDMRDGRIEISGAAQLGPAAVTGRFVAPFKGGDVGFTGTARLTPEVLAHFAPGLPAGTLSGAANADVALTFAGGMRLSLSSDMAGAGLAIPQIGWRKAPATRGQLDIALRLGASPQIERLTARFDDFDAEGAVDLDAGGLREARLSRLRVGDWLDAPLTLAPQDGHLQITTRGGEAHLTRAIAAIGGGTRTAGAGGQSAMPHLRLALDRVRLTDGIALTGFSGDFRPQAGGMGGRFVAAVNAGSQINGTLMVEDGRPSVQISGTDAGRTLQAAGVFANAQGGAFQMTVTPAAQAGEYNGHFQSGAVSVYDAPVIASILNAASIVGLVQQMGGQGLVFDEVMGYFRISPDRISILEASAVGPGLGISLDGVYRLDSGVMDFQGVVSPFYLFNVVGAILTRRGEGLFGVNFTLQGPASALQVGVNPLSILTPGMFREIFRRPPPVVD